MINYYLLTKPGIIFGNLVTLAAGFLLASKGSFDYALFLTTLLGLTFIMASACVLNNYIDRHIDAKMKRTKNRALVIGLIPVKSALAFSIGLVLLGNLFLGLFTNARTLAIADFGFFVYVVLYSLWKCRTIYGTAIGAVAGAIPPVVGYCAVSNQLDLGAGLLFALMVLWQMPHFFSIALFHIEDYTAAGIPLLPVLKGAWRTKIHMVAYILGFILSAFLLTYYGFTGMAYFLVIGCTGLTWLVFCLQGFNSNNDKLWGFKMYRLSLLMIMMTCLMIPIDRI